MKILPTSRLTKIEYIIAPLTEKASSNKQLEIVIIVSALSPLKYKAPPYVREETSINLVSLIFSVTFVACNRSKYNAPP
jgi:hypothetical protein